MRKPIKDRIIAAIRANGGSIGYYELARAVFPETEYPRAFSYPTKGGPPGCYMALSSAIARHGFHMEQSSTRNAGVVHSTVTMGRAARRGGAK
jgi:hypothetical protein